MRLAIHNWLNRCVLRCGDKPIIGAFLWWTLGFWQRFM